MAPDLGLRRRRYADPRGAARSSTASSDMHQFRNWRWYKGLRRRAHRRPRLAPDRHLHLVPRRQPVSRRWPAAGSSTTTRRRTSGTTPSMAVYDYDTPDGPGEGLLPGRRRRTAAGGYLRELHGRERLARPVRDPPRAATGPCASPTPPNGIRWPRPACSSPRPCPSRSRRPRNIYVDVRVTAEAGRWPLPVELAKPAHQPHLENFFDAVRHGTPLNCPAELAYEVVRRRAQEPTRPSRPARSSSSGRRCSKHEPRGTDRLSGPPAALGRRPRPGRGRPGRTAAPAPAQNGKHVAWDGSRTLPPTASRSATRTTNSSSRPRRTRCRSRPVSPAAPATITTRSGRAGISAP
ncbi:MAG: hypothetical protein MZV64_33870 [Ignavibacteriales bacterium]|nr:hypothetical protein [Ignavibacteriales bacterium]